MHSTLTHLSQRMPRTLAIALALSWLLVPISARGQCFSNAIQCNGSPFFSDQYTFSTACSGPPTDPGNGGLSYDLRAGQFQLHGSGAGWSGAVVAGDNYTLMGLPSGSPVTLTLRVHVKETFTKSRSSAETTSETYVTNEFGTENALFRSTGPIDSTKTIALHVHAGQPFPIYYSVTAGQSWGTMAYTCSFVFEDLPAGAVLTSCQGYHQEPPVPALPISWGRLKADRR